jgi:uncharacterized protein
MSQLFRYKCIAFVVIATVAAAACSSGSSKTTTTKKSSTNTTASLASTATRQITINPLFVSTNASGHSTGGTEAVQVDIRPSIDHKLRVAFSETEVAGTGAQWQAAGWNAVAVATLLTGAPLSNREIDFDVTGRIDGPSAGALMTIAVIALIRGDKLQSNITMTGTINPDGTIGPVGGIPYKVAGVVAAHKTRMLIPEGQRNSADDSGKLVDIVEAGQAKGIAVTEVANVYDAYKDFTGKSLAQLPTSTNTALDESAYEKIQAKVVSWLAKFSSAKNDFDSLAPVVRHDLASYVTSAQQDQQESTKLTNEGLQAGAFTAAVNAAALMNAIDHAGQSLQVLLTQGVKPFVSRIKASQSVQGEITGLVDTLKAFTPQTVSDASALIAAYGNAIDAVSLSTFAENLFDEKVSSDSQAVSNAVEGALYYDIAGTLTDAANDILSVGQGFGGPKLGTKVDKSDVATFFRLAAEANLSAFQAVVIAPQADAANVSLSAAENVFAADDSDYALAQTGDNIISSLPPYFGNGATTDYAELGGAISLYERTAALIAKYYSLGQINPKTLALTGIGNDAAFNSAISLAQTQLASNIGLLRSKGVNPTIAAADNEIASVDQNGDVSDKFDALGEYWDGYLNSRVLAYLGWFPQP